MGQHGGHNTPVDSSGWDRPVSSRGDNNIPPAPTEIDPETGTRKRSVTPELTAIHRNFSRSSR